MSPLQRWIYSAFAAALLLGCGGSEPQPNVTITMDTSLGEIEIELFSSQAPKTVSNFLRLVDGGHLNGAAFYRSVSPATDNGSPLISVIQGGLGDAAAPFDPIDLESTEESGILHIDGTLSMARSTPTSATNEFFITIGDQPALDHGATRNADGQGFAAFGRVVSGGDVVRAIHTQPTEQVNANEYLSGQILSELVEIKSVSRKHTSDS